MRVLFPSRESMISRGPFTRWDLIVLPLLMVGLYLLTVAFQGASVAFSAESPDLTVDLDPANLPYYGLRTIFRMLLAVLLSLVFTLSYGAAAAKIPRAERVLVPTLDFLQSLPILGFLTVTTTIFLGLFRGSLLGLEAVAIFAIFTSQAWNMTFSFYQSLITTPRELREASSVLRLSAWDRFWQMEVPFAMPGLTWNTMMSVSGGWFFVVASEAISVVGRDNKQYLPGVGAYLARAVEQASVPAMVYSGLTLLILVLIYDQLIFRPIVAWAEKFKFEQSESEETPQSWMLDLLRRARFVQRLLGLPRPVFERFGRTMSRQSGPGPRVERDGVRRRREQTVDRAWTTGILAVSLVLIFILARFMFGPTLGIGGGGALAPNPNLNAWLSPDVSASFESAGVDVGEDETVYLSDVCAASDSGRSVSPELEAALHAETVHAPDDLSAACAESLVPAGNVSLFEIAGVVGLGLLTMLRVVAMIAIATLIWTPIGVWIGLRPRVAQLVQPIIQFAASFPANLLFPIAVVLITRFALNEEIWLAPLMVMGTQWYILFNVIAGTIGIPNDLKEAAGVMGLRGWAWWRTLVIPGIFPAFVTGGITASGGSWNASIVAEVVSWGSVTLVATGLGAYIAKWSTGAFNPHVALGMLVMGLLVLTFNRLLWRRLYVLAEERFRLG